MMKKNGFISISVIYSFFIVFLLLLSLMMSTYVNNRYISNIYKLDIKKQFNQKLGSADNYDKLYEVVLSRASDTFDLDVVKEGAYKAYFRGNDVDNYITFNEESWRILSVLRYNDQFYTRIIRASVMPIKAQRGFGFPIGDFTTTNMYAVLNSWFNNLNDENKAMLYNALSDTYEGKDYVSSFGLLTSKDYGKGSTGANICDYMGSYSCQEDNWLYIANGNPLHKEWLMDPLIISDGYKYNARYINYTGKLANFAPSNKLYYRPVVNLATDVVVTGGTGTQTDPYTIMMGG